MQEAMDRLPNSAAWASFLARQAGGAAAYIDPRSGTPANILVSVPLIPGTGKGNTLTLTDLGLSLGSPVTEISAEVVAAIVRGYVLNNLDVLAVAADQLGPVQAAQVTDWLWQFSIPQEAGGVRVRYARLAGALNHGNLVLLGTEMWGNVQIDTRPTITGDDAIGIGFAYAGGRLPEDTMWKEPLLELIPYAPAGREIAYAPGGPIGQGYGHRLVWSFGFERASELGSWEVLVDAHAGEVVAFQDVIHYAKAPIKGGVYPATNTEICPSADQRCGFMQSEWPMPWADFKACSNQPSKGCAVDSDCSPGGVCQVFFTNGAGLFDCTSGSATTTLNGKYYKITVPACGTLSQTVVCGAPINLDGTNGQHDCDKATISSSNGNVPAARASYYEVNKIAEIARGWLPNNGWLLRTAPNQFLIKAVIPAVCNAFYDNSDPNASFIAFTPGQFDTVENEWICRSPGEIATIVSHEWGHALDDNDALGEMSNPSEAYADIAAMYRQQASCGGYGNRGRASVNNRQCPTALNPFTSDGTGYNWSLEQVGLRHCFTDCSGAREMDYTKHADGLADTTQNFVCGQCSQSGLLGPCGREVHCAAAPIDQAAWDLATRDLRAAPFSFGFDHAFIVASKLFYEGSGNVGAWYSCDCGAGTSGGCGAGSGYQGWLTADDDNGNILDGTPHATALAAAFERHNIGCPGQIPGNSGCSGWDSLAPTVTSAMMTPTGVDLTWTTVPGSDWNWVFRTEGHAGCNLGKARIAQLGESTSYHDAEVAETGRRYFYSVVAQAAIGFCFSASSECKLPDQVAASELMIIGTIAAGSHLDVRTSNNVREQLREALSKGVSRLSHQWRFDGVPKTTTSPPTKLKLVLEGYRPNNAESDNFQFAYSADGGNNWTNINGAVINSQLEPIFTFDLGQPLHGGMILIRVEDTNQTSGNALDSVFIDKLVLRVE